MNLFYAKSTGGFYDSAINTFIPGDAVSITQAQHDALMVAQSTGKVISADVNGNPIAVNPPAPTTAQLWTAYQLQAQALLVASDTTMHRCVESLVAVPAAWATYRRALRAI